MEETSYKKYITNGKDKSTIKTTYQNGEIRVKDRREIEKKYNCPFVLAYGSNFFTDYRFFTVYL